MTDKMQKESVFLWWAVFLLLVLAGARILYYLVMYGDIYPQWDEWKYVPVKGSIWAHLFDYNNENLQFFTNLQYLLVEKSGLPFKSNVFISYGVYLLLVVMWYRFLRSYVVLSQRWILLLCFLPLFADYMLDNLFWPILSQTWWYFFFMLMAVYFGFDRKQDLSFRVKSAVMILCSVLAMNISFIILFSVCYLLKNIYNAKMKNRKSEVLFAFIWLECLAGILSLFFLCMQDSMEINWKTLFSPLFYQQFFYILIAPLSGFFIKPEMHLLAMFCGIILSGWLMFLFVQQFAKQKGQGVLALAVILVGGIAAITLFRGDLVYSITEHAGRYLPYVFFFVPVLFVLGNYGDNRILKRINYGLVSVILLCTIGGQFNQRYNNTLERIAIGQDCIKSYYNESIPRPVAHFCINKFGKSMSPYLDHFEKVFLRKNSE